MRKANHSLTELIRKTGSTDTTTALVIQLVYHLYANSYSQAIVSITGTVVLAVMIGKTYYGLWFKIVLLFYIISTFLIAWANQHIRRKIKDTKVFQYTLYELGRTMRSLAILLQKHAKKLKKLDKTKRIEDFKNDEKIDFQSVAFIVCEHILNALSRKDEKDDVFVSVYQKCTDSDSAYCKMIAHSEKYEVTGFGTKYPILEEHKDMFGKIEYHTYIFACDNKEVTTFHTQDLVQKAFCLHEGRKDREKLIQQYICIPIAPAGLGVTFLLQVDTNTQGLFGLSKTDVDDFAKNTIYPFAQLLHMAYEQLRVLRLLTDG